MVAASAVAMALLPALAAPPRPAAPPFTVSERAPLLSRSQMLVWGVRWPDAGLYQLLGRPGSNGNGGRQFFVESGPPMPLDFHNPWTVMSSGGSARFGVTEREGSPLLRGFPCPAGYPRPCLRKPPTPQQLWLNKQCTDAPTQRWAWSAAGPGAAARVRSAGGGCVQAYELSTAAGCAAHDVHLAACPPPDRAAAGPGSECDTAGWISQPQASEIVSAMPATPAGAKDQCLQVGSDNLTIVLDTCRGGEREQWSVNGTAIVSSLGGCVDSSPSPLVDSPFVGDWVSNVYNAGEDGILAFVHLEFHHPPEAAGD